MRVAAACLIPALAAFGQPSTLEVKGVVVEPGLNLGVAAAEVTLFEFVLVDNFVTRAIFATTSTDAQGTFLFHPEHFGDYYVETKKEGYSSLSRADTSGSVGTPVKLDRDHLSMEVRFSLARPSELTGRVIDEAGKPVAALSVTVQAPESGQASSAVTDKDGFFTAAKLMPGEYVARITPKPRDPPVASFSTDDLKIVDQDFEASYWPGGFDSPSTTVPVMPGSSVSIGTITVRKTSYYRAHVSVIGGDCAPGERWAYSVINANATNGATGYFPSSCMEDFIVRNLRPGSYWISLSKGPAGDGNKWALGRADVTRENVEIRLKMSPSVDVKGRVIAAEGATLPPLNSIRIMLRPAIAGLLPGNQPLSPDAEGKFVFENVPWPRHRVMVNGLSGRYYVKEIRFNGVAAVDGIITTEGSSGQPLEIVIDDQAAALTGSVTDGDKPVDQPIVLLVKWPLPEDPSYPLNFERAVGGHEGKYQFTGVTPGEYRVVAVSAQALGNKPLSPTLVNQLANGGEKVTLERGGSLNLALKLTDPLH